MKNPHIRTLPSHRPRGINGFAEAGLYGKRFKKARKLWLRGKGPKPLPLSNEIGSISYVSFRMFP